MQRAWRTRRGTGDDYPHFVRFFAELGVDDPVPDRARWESMAPRALFLDDGGGAPAAYALSALIEGAGYVYHVVVDPAFRGRGVGSALMAALASRLRGEGCARWVLNVKTDNTPAIRLYERWGMRRVRSGAALVLPWDRAPLLPREGSAIEARILTPGDDAAIEATFDLLPGTLAHQRKMGDRIHLRLWDPARPDDASVGAASFLPSFPGASLFRVARPSLAPVLLDAIRSHARPGDAHVNLFVDADDALVKALLAAGAVMRFETHHYRGDIPPL